MHTHMYNKETYMYWLLCKGAIGLERREGYTYCTVVLSLSLSLWGKGVTL